MIIVTKTNTGAQALRRRICGTIFVRYCLSRKPTGYRELFTVETDQKKRSIRAVGVDSEGRHILEHYEEYSIGSAIGSAGAYYVLTDQEFRRYARMALVNGHISSEDHARFTSAISSDN